MKKIFAGAFVAALLLASPAWAQALDQRLDNEAALASLNFEASQEGDIDTGLQGNLQDIIAEAGGKTNIDDMTDEQVAAALQALIEANPNLTTNQVTALVRAAASGNPGAVVMITAAAVAARPAAVNQIASAASTAAIQSGNSGRVGAIVAAAVQTANRSGVSTSNKQVADAVADKTGLDSKTIEDAADESDVEAVFAEEGQEIVLEDRDSAAQDDDVSPS